MEKEYLIREKPLKALLLFALPMIIGNLFQQFIYHGGFCSGGAVCQ